MHWQIRVRRLFYWKKMEKEQSEVVINIYQLIPEKKISNVLKFMKIGLYHTGVELYGNEYMFCNSVGITSCKPKEAFECKYLKSISLGFTNVTHLRIIDLLRQNGRASLVIFNFFAVSEFSAKKVRRIWGLYNLVISDF